jgi:steroid 5-alpha reductase family enzyme
MADLTRLGALNAGVILSLMAILWLVSIAKRDASIVDPFWGTGFAIVAWVTAGWHGFAGSRSLLVAGLASVWGLRLSLYLLWRNRSKGEDFRYRAMREKHGDKFWLVSLVTVFGLQGLIMWLVSWPVQFGQAPSVSSLFWLDGFGMMLWAAGFFFESFGDSQLARFKADPANRGRVMDRGLWRYTRHPNYFGDFCVWWGLYVIAAAGGAWWTFPGPLLMTFFLMKVSGVPMLEKTLSERRPGYASYVKRTNAFFPGPPRSS